jgi:hypothetical protein
VGLVEGGLLVQVQQLFFTPLFWRKRRRRKVIYDWS